MHKKIVLYGTTSDDDFINESYRSEFIECPNCLSRSSHSKIKFNDHYDGKEGLVIISLCLACSSRYHTLLTFDELKILGE